MIASTPAVAATLRKKPVLLTVSKHISMVHRYLGIAIGFMFAVWFATGSVLSFVPFPTLEIAERIGGRDTLEASEIRVSPATALAVAGTPSPQQLRLLSVAGQPRYVVSDADGTLVSVSARNGSRLRPLTRAEAGMVAEGFTGSAPRAIEGPLEYDQWTVHDRYDAHRPYYRVSVQDGAGTAVYVSVASGEVLQRTTRKQRAWNRVGAVVHWLNVTALRKHDRAWSWMIWTLALTGIALVLMGAWLGAVRYVNLKRMQRPGLSPFTGWLRWHHSLGLFAAVLVLNWIGSGWLSVDNGGALFSSDQPTKQQLESLRGMSLAKAARSFPELAPTTLAEAREIEFTALGARPLLIVRGDTATARVFSVDADRALHASAVIEDQALLNAVRAAWAPVGADDIQAVAADDAYRLRTVPWPASTRRVRLNDESGTWVHIDAASGEIVSVMDKSRRLYRWIVSGPHNLDYPIFHDADLLRHVVLLTATTIGFVFSCTGVVLGIKRVRRLLA